MIRTIYLFIVVLFIPAFLKAQELTLFNVEANKLFMSFAKDGHVYYRGIKEDFDLNNTYKLLKKIDINDLHQYQKKSFLINVYNFLVIKQVADSYPVKSVDEISGFFTEKKFNIGKEDYSLNDLEKLLHQYEDHRVFTAIIKGTKSCPPVPEFAFFPQNLNYKLTEQARKTLEKEHLLQIDENNKTLKIGSFMKQYEAFHSKDEVLTFITQHHHLPVGKIEHIEYIENSRELNDAQLSHSELQQHRKFLKMQKK